LKLNVQHELLVYADDINILGWSVHTVEKNTDALVVSNEETGLEVNNETAKYMVMSRDQKAGQNHNIKTINNLFEKA
jgi:hypothetical protein